MKKNSLISLLLLLIPVLLFSQYNSVISKDIKYYGKDFFRLEGTEIPDSLKENRYHRLPISYKNIVREPVWNLSKSSAGLSIRFLSNSNTIYILCNKSPILGILA